jgi:predicted nucleic acid-binding protein
MLDTNIISNVVSPTLSASLLDWMAEQRNDALFIASLTVAEIRRGILKKPVGRRREALNAWFAGPKGPQALFGGRILPFDDLAGLIWVRLMADGKIAGRPRSGLDVIVAAVADANNCVVVTDNKKDFAELQFINPLHGAV